VNQFLIEAFTTPHDGRTRRFYVMAPTVEIAVEDFTEGKPDAVVRSVWEFVSPTYYQQYTKGGHLLPTTSKEKQ
jgi:hypothetical protein